VCLALTRQDRSWIVMMPIIRVKPPVLRVPDRLTRRTFIRLKERKNLPLTKLPSESERFKTGVRAGTSFDIIKGCTNG
jgi:hypothetical protein